jgi:hypothetical protein
MPSDPLVVVARLAEIFDHLGIPYFVGGSLASSLHGIPRASNDVDVAAVVKPAHVQKLIRALEDEFYVAEEFIVEAIRDLGSFNVIHLGTMFKADIFVLEEQGWPQRQMLRARTEVIASEDTSLAIRFATPEDTILQKLMWYREGGSVSEQQWKDVQGVLQVQGEALDFAYMEECARILSIADLLQRARESLL